MSGKKPSPLKGQILLRPPTDEVNLKRFHQCRDAVTDELRKNKEAKRGPTSWMKWFLAVCEERYRVQEAEQAEEKRLEEERAVHDKAASDEDRGGLF